MKGFLRGDNGGDVLFEGDVFGKKMEGQGRRREDPLP